MNLGRYLDWRFRCTTWITLLVAVACVAGAWLLPASFGDKNSPIENVQMLIVASGLYFSITARNRTSLFAFASFVLFFILAREVNYGRTLFVFADPENANIYPKWKDMEYGWLAHALVGVYMVWLVVYFFWRKVWMEAWNVCRSVRMPVVDVLLTLCAIVSGIICESLHQNLPEELSEVVLYVGGIGVIYLYSRNAVTKVG